MKTNLLGKILALILLVVTIITFNSPIVEANSENEEQTETISIPATVTHYQSSLERDVSTLGYIARAMIEAGVKLVTFIPDSISTVFTAFMRQEDIEAVMKNYPQNSGREVDASISLDKSKYDTYKLLYPDFKYSPEEIFSGEIDLLDIDFISGDNEDIGWHKIRNAVASWYKVLRLVALVGLLSVLIYTGIKIILSSTAKDKAKYKKFLIDWLIGMILVFVMQYIMAFIVIAVKEFMQLFSENMGDIQVTIGGTTFTTNLIGLARFQIQEKSFISKLGYLLMYIALVTYTFKFTFIYVKRVCYMAFLTLVSPIVALTYPIDKMGDGKAQGFQMWLREYVFNALLQPIHYLMYYVLVYSALTLAANNLLYGIIVLHFMLQAEKLLKQIFQFGKAGGGTVGGLATAITAGTMLSNLSKNLRHGFGRHVEKNARQNNFSDNSITDERPGFLVEDTGIENFLNNGNISGELEGSFGSGDSGNSENNDGRNTNGGDTNTLGTNRRLPVNTSIEQFRRDIADQISDDTKIKFADGDPRTLEELFDLIYKNQVKLEDPNLSDDERRRLINEIELAKVLIQSRMESGEYEFNTNGLALQYLDGDSRTSMDLINSIIYDNYKAHSNEYKDTSGMQFKYKKQAENDLKILKRRISENNYINSQGGARLLFSTQVSNKSKQNNKFTITMSRQNDSSTTSVDRNQQVKIEASNNGQNEGGTEERKHSDMFDAYNYVKNLLGRKHYGDPRHKRTVRGGMPTLGSSRNFNTMMGDNEGQAQNNDYGNINMRSGVLPPVLSQRVSSDGQYTQDTHNLVKDIVENAYDSKIGRGTRAAARTLIKPVWDMDKSAGYNGQRLVGKAVKGAAQFGAGMLVAAVQAGISITDGKYNIGEGVASFAAGAAAVDRIASKGEKALEHEPDNLKAYQRAWYDRDDVIKSYNDKYDGNAKEAQEARERARDNYVIRGITDPKEQQQAMKFANKVLSEGKVHSIEEADKLAIAILEYRRNLMVDSNFGAVYDSKEQTKYLDAITEKYTGTQKQVLRRTHKDFINYVAEFDKVNS